MNQGHSQVPAAPPKKSDLGVRTVSAIVMVAVATAAIWLGGLAWAAFVALVAAGVLWEWVKLSRRIASRPFWRALWFMAGVCYVGVAGETLVTIANMGTEVLLFVISAVIATDIGAYFFGRTFGGPKIAPKISPSKTWSGLVGGMILAGIVLVPQLDRFWICPFCLPLSFTLNASRSAFLAGAAIAIIAQAGDFFESWLKRRAGVKDSGHLIPGHGGLFDRVDGLLAVLFVVGLAAGTERFL